MRTMDMHRLPVGWIRVNRLLSALASGASNRPRWRAATFHRTGDRASLLQSPSVAQALRDPLGMTADQPRLHGHRVASVLAGTQNHGRPELHQGALCSGQSSTPGLKIGPSNASTWTRSWNASTRRTRSARDKPAVGRADCMPTVSPRWRVPALTGIIAAPAGGARSFTVDTTAATGRGAAPWASASVGRWRRHRAAPAVRPRHHRHASAPVAAGASPLAGGGRRVGR